MNFNIFKYGCLDLKKNMAAYVLSFDASSICDTTLMNIWGSFFFMNHLASLLILLIQIWLEELGCFFLIYMIWLFTCSNIEIKKKFLCSFLFIWCDCLQIQMKRQMRHVCLVSYFLFVYNLYKGNENVSSITCNCLII